MRRAGHEDVGRDRVKRLMRAHGLQGAKRRGKPWRTTTPDPSAQRPPDLVDRDFTAQRPDELWVADFTDLRCWDGLVFFSFVIGVFSRRVVGWQFSPSAERQDDAVSDEKVCAYCGQLALTGDEDPEHAVPAAVGGRFTTMGVCVPCNRWAGREIDQPWLDDPFVLDRRFEHEIADRRGRTVDSSPLLTGKTDDGRWVTMDRDGVPVLRNAPVEVDDAAGVLRVTAADPAALKAQTDKQVRKLRAAGRTVTPIETTPRSDRPQITAGGQVAPGRWHRMGAKVALALLAEQQPAAWRRGKSADLLRTAMRARPAASEVRFAPLNALATFAAQPATAVVLSRPGPMVLVSLMGILGVGFLLAEDLDRADWAWVADPLDADTQGPLAEVIHARHRAAGLLDEPPIDD